MVVVRGTIFNFIINLADWAFWLLITSLCSKFWEFKKWTVLFLSVSEDRFQFGNKRVVSHMTMNWPNITVYTVVWAYLGARPHWHLTKIDFRQDKSGFIQILHVDVLYKSYLLQYLVGNPPPPNSIYNYKTIGLHCLMHICVNINLELYFSPLVVLHHFEQLID